MRWALYLAAPRPIDDVRAIQGPPHDKRLQHQTEAMIDTAIGDVWQVNSIDRMFEVGGPDADGVDGHGDACPMTKLPGYERDGDSELENAGEKNDLRGIRNPRRCDF